MFCSQCGAPMGDNDKFCGSCGAPNAYAPSAQAAPGEPQNPQVQPTPQPPKPKGCMAQAFNDLTRTPGVFKRICQIGFLPALLCIVSVVALFVPVIGGIAAAIGFLLAIIASECGTGFGIEWGSDLATGAEDGMKRPLLRSSSFGLGLFSSVLAGVLEVCALIPVLGVFLSVIESVVLGAAGSYYFYGSSALGAAVIGSLGLLVIAAIASVVLSVFFKMFSQIAVMHFAVNRRVDSAFSLRRVWQAFKSNKTKLFCAAILPEFLCSIAVYVVNAIITALFGFIASLSYSAYGSFYRPEGLEAILASGGVLLVLFLALTVFVTVFAGVFGKMLKYRAVGYWVKRYAPDWTDDDEQLMFVLPGEPAVEVPASAAAEPAAEPVADAAPASEPAEPVAEPADDDVVATVPEEPAPEPFEAETLSDRETESED